MDDTEQRVLDAIDHEGMMEFIARLVSTPSHGGDETAAQRIVAEELRNVGFEVDTWMIDFELRRHPEFSMSMPREEGLGVAGTWGEGERCLIICGHIDTVAPGDREAWGTPPLEATVADGRLHGRGTVDMKAGLACGLYAVKAVMDAGVKPRGRVTFLSVIGEEDGGCGALAACLRGYRGDAGIIMEPSETKIAPEVAGAMSFRVTVPGRSAHACVREEGVSAIDKFIALAEGLRELEAERNRGVDDALYNRYEKPYALSIGTVHGGEWPGTVPDKVVFEGRLGVKVGESREEARRQLEDKVDAVADGDPWLRVNRPRVEWAGYSFAPSRVELDHPIVEAVAEAYRDAVGLEPVYEGMTYASDARLLIDVGDTPTIVFGPGDVRDAHSANESVSLEELDRTVRTLALTVLRYLGHQG